MADSRGTIIVTGSSGFIGRAIVDRLATDYAVLGFDLYPPKSLPAGAGFARIDLSSDDSVRDALARVRQSHGDRLAAVIHLAAYFDLTGQPDPRYDEITVRGTGRLLRELHAFSLERLIYVSTMLVHLPGRPGETIDEDRPLDPKLPYRASKILTEDLIHRERGAIPVVYLRAAGIFDDLCRNVFLARQIARIHQHSIRGRVYPGDLRTGQSFLHLDDLVDAVVRITERRRALPPELPLLLGDPDAIGYGDLQAEIGRLLHGEPWNTWEIPKPLAKAGAWVETELLGEDPFIRPWMVDIADDHYALDIARARTLLDWQPRRPLRTVLPRMIEALKADPVAWYQANKLNPALVAAQAPHRAAEPEQGLPSHLAEMAVMHHRRLWVHFLVIALGLWLLTSPFQFGLFDPAATQTVRDVTAERGLWQPGLRNALTGWSDVVSGLLLVLFGTLSLSPRWAWAQWGTCLVGLWLLFAPLLLWTPSAAAYANDTMVGTLAIVFAVLVPMMPGMSHAGMMDDSTIPAGWTYSPSSWLQRLPIVALGLFGFLIARALAAYQLGHIDGVWDPFFSGPGGRNGTEHIITSDISRAWPIADGGLGATTYLLEMLMGAMGGVARWRTMPWMVTFFFILVVPLGGVSIFFIIIQPIIIGTYCTLCLIAAFFMLLMIPLALDEVVAMAQYLRRAVHDGRPLLRTFLRGGPDPAGQTKEEPRFDAPLAVQAKAVLRGVTMPWSLLASGALGLWLMASRAVFGTVGAVADNDHLIGALVLTVAVSAMAEVARPLRLVNAVFGLWLIAVPWLLAGAGGWATVNDMLCGLLILGLSLPRGCRSREHYGAWDRYVV